MMPDIAVIVLTLQYGTDVCYFYPRERSDGQKMVGRVKFLSFILVGVGKKLLVQEEKNDTGFPSVAISAVGTWIMPVTPE